MVGIMLRKLYHATRACDVPCASSSSRPSPSSSLSNATSPTCPHLIREEEDGGMRWRRDSRCPSPCCLALGAEQRQMAWNGVSGDRIGILSPLGLTLSLI